MLNKTSAVPFWSVGYRGLIGSNLYCLVIVRIGSSRARNNKNVISDHHAD